MKSLVIIVIGIIFSWNSIDFLSDKTTSAVIAPLMFGVFIVAAIAWLLSRSPFKGTPRGGGVYIDDYHQVGYPTSEIAPNKTHKSEVVNEIEHDCDIGIDYDDCSSDD